MAARWRGERGPLQPAATTCSQARINSKCQARKESREMSRGGLLSKCPAAPSGQSDAGAVVQSALGPKRGWRERQRSNVHDDDLSSLLLHLPRLSAPCVVIDNRGPRLGIPPAPRLCFWAHIRPVDVDDMSRPHRASTAKSGLPGCRFGTLARSSRRWRHRPQPSAATRMSVDGAARRGQGPREVVMVHYSFHSAVCIPFTTEQALPQNSLAKSPVLHPRPKLPSHNSSSTSHPLPQSHHSLFPYAE
jgi:hypothetical protein